MHFLTRIIELLKKKDDRPHADIALVDTNVMDSDAPWVKAHKQYENTNVRLNAQVSNWRLFVFLLLIIVCISVIGNVVQGSQSKMIPYLVEVDKLGRTIAVRALEGNEAVTDKRRLVYREMFDVIENIRTVSSDPSVNKQHLTHAYSRLSGAAVKYVTEELKRNPPNVVGATQTVEVEVRAAIPISKKTWQVEWVERTYSLAGVLSKTDNWKASLTYELTPSGLEESIRDNPIGYTVTDISWLRII